METLLWVILGIYGLFATHFGLQLIRENHDIKLDSVLLLVTGILCFSVAMTLCGVSICKTQPPSISSSKFNVKIDVKQEIMNGKITSIDTIYKFIPKKK